MADHRLPRAELFSRLVHPVSVGSKLPQRPRTIKALRNENDKFQQDGWQRLDGTMPGSVRQSIRPKRG